MDEIREIEAKEDIYDSKQNNITAEKETYVAISTIKATNLEKTIKI